MNLDVTYYSALCVIIIIIILISLDLKSGRPSIIIYLLFSTQYIFEHTNVPAKTVIRPIDSRAIFPDE